MPPIEVSLDFFFLELNFGIIFSSYLRINQKPYSI